MNTNAKNGKGQTTFNARQNFGERCVASCKKLLTQLENVKAAVVSDFRDRLEGHQRVLELALNEAEALAWDSGFPELMFPDLALEKAYALAGWHERQQVVLRRNSPRLLVA